jgi:hypothetical protein
MEEKNQFFKKSPSLKRNREYIIKWKSIVKLKGRISIS